MKTIVRASISLCKEEDKKLYEKIAHKNISDLDIFRLGMDAVQMLEDAPIKNGSKKPTASLKGSNARAKA